MDDAETNQRRRTHPPPRRRRLRRNENTTGESRPPHSSHYRRHLACRARDMQCARTASYSLSPAGLLAGGGGAGLDWSLAEQWRPPQSPPPHQSPPHPPLDDIGTTTIMELSGGRIAVSFEAYRLFTLTPGVVLPPTDRSVNDGS